MKTISTPAATSTRRRGLSLFSKIMIGIIFLLLFILSIFTFLDTRGLHLLIPEIITVGYALVLIALVLWGAVSLYLRLRSERAKKYYRVIGLSLGAGLSMFAVVMAIQLTMYAMPHTYGTILSPSGQKVVILRVNDMGAGDEAAYKATIDRMNLRASILTGEPVAEGMLAEYPMEAYGYAYIAMPRKAGIFYTSNVLLDGAVYRGQTSESSLRFEWTDDTTVRFYLENPAPGDEGEMTLYLEP